MTYDYFVGKLCTILTNATNRSFTDQQHASYFTGMVKEVTEKGVWIELLPRRTKSFFWFPLVGIVEEVFTPLTPKQQEEVKKQLEKEQTKQPATPGLVDLGMIKRLQQSPQTRPPK